MYYKRGWGGLGWGLGWVGLGCSVPYHGWLHRHHRRHDGGRRECQIQRLNAQYVLSQGQRIRVNRGTVLHDHEFVLT